MSEKIFSKTAVNGAPRASAWYPIRRNPPKHYPPLLKLRRVIRICIHPRVNPWYSAKADKILSILVLLGMFFAPLSPFLEINQAYALEVAGTGEGTVIIQNIDPGTVKQHAESTTQTIGQKITAAMTSAFKYIKSMEWSKALAKTGKDAAFEVLRQAVLDQLVNNLIRWIEGGGRGAIVDNWEAFFEDAANKAGGIFADKMSRGILCSGFNLQVQLALLPVNRFENNITCTLNDVIRNIDSFMEDFRNGNWLAYQTTWEPRNNFYGATLMALDEQDRVRLNASVAAASEAAAGNGFLSFKKCEIVQDDHGTLDKNGQPLKEFTGPELSYSSHYSQQCRVTTPGEVVAKAATKTLVDAPFNAAGSATSNLIAGYLTAIVNASVNTLTKAATEGFKGVLAERLKGTRVQPLFPCAGLTGESFNACKNSVNAERSEFQATQLGTVGIVRQAIDLRYQLAGIYSQSISLQQGLVSALDQLTSPACSNNNSQDLLNQKTEQQTILDILQQKFADNQAIIDPVEQQTNSIYAINPEVSITPDDLSALANANLNLGNDDSGAIATEIVTAENDLRIIQENVATQLPDLESRIQQFCPQTQNPAP